MNVTTLHSCVTHLVRTSALQGLRVVAVDLHLLSFCQLYQMLNEYPQTIKWGIIGCGDVCKVKAGPTFNNIPGSELHAVCRRDAEKAEQFAVAFNAPHWYPSMESLLENSHVNAVYIATPPSSHLALALKAAEAGLPALVEKPMARCATEAAIMCEAFERRNLPLFVAYYRRALPRYKRVKEILHSVGDVLSVEVKVLMNSADQGWRVDKSISGGGLFVDLGSHVCDILEWMFGSMHVTASLWGNEDVHSWQSMAEDSRVNVSNVEKFAIFTFDLPNQPYASRNVACFDFESKRSQKDQIEVKGSKGTLTFPALGLPNYDPTIRLITGGGSVILEETIENPKHVHGPLIKEVVDYLRGTTAKCCSTGMTGLRAAITVDAVLEWGKNSRFLRQRSFVDGGKLEYERQRILEKLQTLGRSINAEL